MKEFNNLVDFNKWENKKGMIEKEKDLIKKLKDVEGADNKGYLKGNTVKELVDEIMDAYCETSWIWGRDFSMNEILQMKIHDNKEDVIYDFAFHIKEDDLSKDNWGENGCFKSLFEDNEYHKMVEQLVTVRSKAEQLENQLNPDSRKDVLLARVLQDINIGAENYDLESSIDNYNELASPKERIPFDSEKTAYQNSMSVYKTIKKMVRDKTTPDKTHTENNHKEKKELER